MTSTSTVELDAGGLAHADPPVGSDARRGGDDGRRVGEDDRVADGHAAQRSDDARADRRVRSCLLITPGASGRAAGGGEMVEWLLAMLRDLGLEARHSTPDRGGAPITTGRLGPLRDADLVIADLTGLDPVVMYLLAIRHALHAPVIAIADRATAVPMELGQHGLVRYDDTAAGGRRLEASLRGAIEVLVDPGGSGDADDDRHDARKKVRRARAKLLGRSAEPAIVNPVAEADVHGARLRAIASMAAEATAEPVAGEPAPGSDAGADDAGPARGLDAVAEVLSNQIAELRTVVGRIDHGQTALTDAVGTALRVRRIRSFLTGQVRARNSVDQLLESLRDIGQDVTVRAVPVDPLERGRRLADGHEILEVEYDAEEALVVMHEVLGRARVHLREPRFVPPGIAEADAF